MTAGWEASMTEQTEGIRRAANGRPYIKDALTGKETSYTRTSTFAKALSDGDALSWWKMERLILGCLKDPTILMASTLRVDEPSREALAQAISRGLKVGGAEEAADWGTILHSIADVVDFSEAPMLREQWILPQSIWDALDAYVELTKDMHMLSGEQFVVCDQYKVAGSYDRTALWNGQHVVADLKTGTVRMPDHGIQMSVYANSKHYDPTTGQRVEGPVDLTSKRIGLIVHLPRPGVKDSRGRQVEPSLIPVDIEEGWKLADLAYKNREARKVKLVPTGEVEE